MIALTRLNAHQVTVNCDLIRLIEASPDTMLTMVSGEKIVVLETREEVVAKVLAWRVELLRSAFGDNPTAVGAEMAASSLAAASACEAIHASRFRSEQAA
ncbi:MAG: flagellar FlbD family protein [Acidobacteriaceae bacterium]